MENNREPIDWLLTLVMWDQGLIVVEADADATRFNLSPMRPHITANRARTRFRLIVILCASPKVIPSEYQSHYTTFSPVSVHYQRVTVLV